MLSVVWEETPSSSPLPEREVSLGGYVRLFKPSFISISKQEPGFGLSSSTDYSKWEYDKVNVLDYTVDETILTSDCIVSQMYGCIISAFIFIDI